MFTNLSVFQAINGLSHQFSLLDGVGIFLADYVAYGIVLVALILIFYPKQHRRRHRIMIALAICSGAIARLVIKTLIVFFYHSPRPFVALHFQPLIKVLTSEYYQSFPSSHALFFFAFSTSIYFFNKRVGTWLLIASCLMGLGRIFVGVHWPYDIFWGAVIGIATSYGMHLLYQRYAEKLK